jgi:hypothetical protein
MTWEYFNAMDAILGHGPATRPPVVIDSLASSSTQNNAQDQGEGDPEDIEEKNDEPGSPTFLNSSTPQQVGSGKQDRKRE